MTFGFDAGIISALNAKPEQSVNELQAFTQAAAQRTQQQQAQAQLADLARRQQQESTMADIYRASAGAPEQLSAALMRGGFGPQAFAAQDQQAQMQSQAATQQKLLREIQDAHRKKVGEIFYGTKGPEDYLARRQQLASDPDPSVAIYAQHLPAEYDPAGVERLGNLAVPAVERAKLAARGTGTGQISVAEDGTQYVVDKKTGAATTVLDEKGNALKARPKGRAGGGGGGAGGGGAADQLSPEALDAMADKFNTTGELTGIGQGKSAMGLKVRIINRALERKPGTDLAGAGGSYKADVASLKKLQTTADAVDAFEATAEKNLDNFTGLATKLKDTGSPLFNAGARKFDEEVAGNPDMAGISAARATAVAEIGKVLSGQTGGGGLTEGARKEVEELIKPGATLAQIMSAANVLKQDMHNRKAAVQDQLKDIRTRLGGKAPAKEGAASSSKKIVKYLVSPDKTRRVPIYADGSEGPEEATK